MRIDDDHMYHGAALTQIAEWPPFKAINALEVNGKRLGCAFLINAKIGVYIKYDSVGPVGKKYPEFKFTFSSKNLLDIASLKGQLDKLYIILVCLKAKEICVITEELLSKLIAARKQLKGTPEGVYQILVQDFERKQFKVYINEPNKKGAALDLTKIPRRDFPRKIFE
jgi:hypothetical protein